MRAGPEEDPVTEDTGAPRTRAPTGARRTTPATGSTGCPRPRRRGRPGERHNRPDAASALPPPPYRAAPPPSTPFNDPGRISSLPPVPPPQPRTPPAPPPATRDRWVPAADDTQVMTSLPPVPRGPVDELAEDIEAREGKLGATRILRAAGTMAVATLVSRITGLLRTIVMAAALGVGLVNDAYTTANTLPNIVYKLLLGGVLTTSVIVPLLVHAQERDRDGGTAYAQRLATIATAGLPVVTALAILVAPLLTSLYGIADDPEQVRLANWLARILLVEIVFYGVGALAQAILNSRDVFGPPAWAPVLNNVVVIATGLLFIAASGPGDLEPGDDHRRARSGCSAAAPRSASPSRRSSCCRLLSEGRRPAAPAVGPDEHRAPRGRDRSASG